MVEITIEVDGVASTVSLWHHAAPRTVAQLVSALPIEGSLRHCRWSGDACFTEAPPGSPLSELEGLESAVTSIYPGVLAIRPPNEVAKNAELLLAYGDAEYRWPDGRRYVTPVGEIQGDASAVFRVLAATSREGEKRIRITAKSEATS